MPPNSRRADDRVRASGMSEVADPMLDLIDRVGTEIIAWIVDVYPEVPQASDIARDAIALFIGGIQERALLSTRRETLQERAHRL